MPGFRAQNHLDHWPVPTQNYFASSVYFIFLLILLQGYWPVVWIQHPCPWMLWIQESTGLGQVPGSQGLLAKEEEKFFSRPSQTDQAAVLIALHLPPQLGNVKFLNRANLSNKSLPLKSTLIVTILAHNKCFPFASQHLSPNICFQKPF